MVFVVTLRRVTHIPHQVVALGTLYLRNALSNKHWGHTRLTLVYNSRCVRHRWYAPLTSTSDCCLRLSELCSASPAHIIYRQASKLSMLVCSLCLVTKTYTKEERKHRLNGREVCLNWTVLNITSLLGNYSDLPLRGGGLWRGSGVLFNIFWCNTPPERGRVGRNISNLHNTYYIIWIFIKVQNYRKSVLQRFSGQPNSLSVVVEVK